MSERQFAFGVFSLSGCACPTYTVGKTGVGIPLFEYDRILRRRHGKKKGVVDEQEAKEAWMKAIFTVVLQAYDDEHDSAHYLRRARNGVEVAEELGWIEDG